jgi:hypothetical protein
MTGHGQEDPGFEFQQKHETSISKTSRTASFFGDKADEA